MSRAVSWLWVTGVWTVLVTGGCVGSGGPDEPGGLKSRNPDVRRERVLQLGREHAWSARQREATVSALTAVGQSDPDPLVRSAALVSLQKQDKEAAQALARQLLSDADALVRWDAVKVLSTSSSREARSGLLYAVRSDSSRDVRREAAKGLSRFPDDEVVEQLLALLGDSDSDVVVASCRSLERISGQKLGAQPGAWQEWYQSRTSIPAPEPDEFGRRLEKQETETPAEPSEPEPEPEVKPERGPEPAPLRREKPEETDIRELRQHRR